MESVGQKMATHMRSSSLLLATNQNVRLKRSNMHRSRLKAIVFAFGTVKSFFGICKIGCWYSLLRASGYSVLYTLGLVLTLREFLS